MSHQEVDRGYDRRDVLAGELLEEQPVAGLLAGLTDPIERLGHAEELETGRDHAKRLRPALDEASSHGTRLEANGRDRGLDGIARRR
jgi:hypothetical protein